MFLCFCQDRPTHLPLSKLEGGWPPGWSPTKVAKLGTGGYEGSLRESEFSFICDSVMKVIFKFVFFKYQNLDDYPNRQY